MELVGGATSVNRCAMSSFDHDTFLANLSPEEGLTFLELFAHDLTIQIRVAADYRCRDDRTPEQCVTEMFRINESLHNVVQLTRDLRVGREVWKSSTDFELV